MDEYIAAGKVRLIYRHFAFLGVESLWAAQASECASDQGQFWAYHDLLFQNLKGRNAGGFSKERLRAFARDLRLDSAAFDQCLESNRADDKVQKDLADGRRLGVRATPTLFINNLKAEGLPSWEDLRQAIEELLAAPGR